MDDSYSTAREALVAFSKNRVSPQWSAEKCREALALIERIERFGVNMRTLRDICQEARKSPNKWSNSTRRKYMLNAPGKELFQDTVNALPLHQPGTPDNAKKSRDPGSMDDDGADLNSGGRSGSTSKWGDMAAQPPRRAGPLFKDDHPIVSPAASASLPEIVPKAGSPSGHVPSASLQAVGNLQIESMEQTFRSAVVHTDIRYHPPAGLKAHRHFVPSLPQRFKTKVGRIAHQVCHFFGGDPRSANAGNASYEFFCIAPNTIVPWNVSGIKAMILERWMYYLGGYHPSRLPTKAERDGCYFFIHLVITVGESTEICVFQMKMFA
jgi:hypothetical protein